MLTNFTDCFSTLGADVASQQMDPVLVHFQVVFLPKCFSALLANMFLLAPVYLMDVGVETLVPASADGAHLLLVEVRRLVVDCRLLLRSKHPLTRPVLARHGLLNNT